MFFITLFKWKQAPKKEMQVDMDKNTAMIKELEKQGIKMRNFWTLGRYDAVSVIEAPSEKDVIKLLLQWQDLVDTETMLAIPRVEGIKLL